MGFGLLTYSKDERTAQASHILLSFEAYPDDSECDGMLMGGALKQKILDGELTFELVAEKFSACSSAEKGGDLGTFKRGAMVPAFDEAVFNSGDGESAPIGTVQGYHHPSQVPLTRVSIRAPAFPERFGHPFR